MKLTQFEEAKVIINGRLYSEFIQNFKENILDMYDSKNYSIHKK